VKVEDINGFVTVLTSVDNKSFRPNKISYSTLLVCQESENAFVAAKTLVDAASERGLFKKQCEFRNLNDLEWFKVKEQISFEDRLWIPVKFYYEGNVDIADETLSLPSSHNSR
jgi:hypothetical protein